MSDDRPAVPSDDPGLATRVYRTVTPAYRGRENTGMNAVGWGMFLGLLVVFVPLLPFVAVAWLVGKAIDAVTPGDHT